MPSKSGSTPSIGFDAGERLNTTQLPGVAPRPTAPRSTFSASSRCQATNLRVFDWQNEISVATCSSPCRPNNQPAGAGDTDGSSRTRYHMSYLSSSFSGSPFSRSSSISSFFVLLDRRGFAESSSTSDTSCFGTYFQLMISNVELLG